MPYEIVDHRTGNITECYVDASKVERGLGWKAKKGIVDMCRDAWDFERGYEKKIGLMYLVIIKYCVTVSI